nr:MAG TPA: tail assembly chaperone protein [Caudoviricetes sp.]
MTTSFKKAYKFDASGFFEHELTVQVMDGNVLMPPSCTLIAPFGDEGEDGSKFYRFTGDAWAAELKPTCAADLVGVVVSHHSQTPHDIEMRSLIQKFSQEEGYREKRGEDLSWSVEKIPEKTEAEKREEAEKSVRAKRDSLISETDYLLASDYPISAEDLEAVKVYRQALRDVPQQEGFPFDVVWPDLPVIVAER